MISIGGRRWQWAEGRGRGGPLAAALGLHPLVADLLAERGVCDVTEAESFLRPALRQLPDPATLAGMETALTVLAEALRAGECIGIFGDYDVDGVCATALVTRYLRALGVEPVRYIPDRLTEGYGPTPVAMEKLAAQGVRVLLTVDTGTTAHAAMARAADLGLRVVVTDHHQPDGPLPPVAALVNPHRPDDVSPLRGLCGSGVIFYVLMALNRHLRGQGFFTPGRPEPRLTDWLDLVALATVADVMPLTGPNRVLVALGLKQLATWKNRGLAALADVAGVKEEVSAFTLGFQLGPRLNAAGRLDSAVAAVELLLCDDDVVAHPLALQLDAVNRERRAVEQEVLREAMVMAEAQCAQDRAVLVLHGKGWHPGVVGIVAGRVKERCGRPVFVMGEDAANGVLKGSARSVPGLNVGAAVHAAHALTLSGGGHAMAAGVTLPAAHVDAFARCVEDFIQADIQRQPHLFLPDLPLSRRLMPPYVVHAGLTPAGCSADLLDCLSHLAPWGPDNPEPLLALGPTPLAHVKTMGADGKHVRLTLPASGGARLSAVMFNAMETPLGPALLNHGGRPVTLLGHLRANTFRGATTLDFYVVDACWGTWGERA